jgi:cytochrome c
MASQEAEATTMKRMKILLATAALAVPFGVQGQDVTAAEALAKKSGCMKCHSVSAKKEGPSFKDTAAKYKGKPDAEKALTTFLTSNPKVKVDGKEEMHDAPKANDQAQITNLVKYILSR